MSTKTDLRASSPLLGEALLAILKIFQQEGDLS